MPQDARSPTPHLRLVSDTRPGIARRRVGNRFSYRRPNGTPVRDAATLDRIRRLAIPPAWTEVWIAPDTNAHIQATGRDARGRKQYRYHTVFRESQEAEKFGRLARFARDLPGLRAAIRRDLNAEDRSREQVLALLVSLLESTYIRVGNEAYVRENGSYGLTTLEDRNVTISGDVIAFDFRGKGGKQRRVERRDGKLARLVQRCRRIPGPHLFQYIDGHGHRRPIHSFELNAYLAQIADGACTAKDFRTWGATLLAAKRLDRRLLASEDAPGKKAMLEDIAAVADELGNTPAVCRKSYIHPALLAAYLDDDRWRRWRRSRTGRSVRGLTAPEGRLLRFLQISTSPARRAYVWTGQRAG